MKDRTLRAYLEAPTEKQLQEAFERGRVAGLTKAVWVVSSRLIPPKNPAYTRAIEESVVFLKAEIERKPDDGNVTTTTPLIELKGKK